MIDKSYRRSMTDILLKESAKSRFDIEVGSSGEYRHVNVFDPQSCLTKTITNRRAGEISVRELDADKAFLFTAATRRPSINSAAAPS